MKNHVVFSRLSFLFTVIAFWNLNSQAQIMSPSAKEVRYSYTASFEMPLTASEVTDLARAEKHASHMFGLFHTPAIVESFGIEFSSSEGIGGPRSQMKISIVSSEVKDDKVKIIYSNSGRMILHNKAADKLLKKGYFELPMPSNPYEIYDKNCTDSHYTSFSDFWYFYDPFRQGCEHLSQEPYSNVVRISIKPSQFKKLETTPQLPLLRGDNGNGKVFSIYVVHGYAENRLADDEGRKNFNGFRDYLIDRGFHAEKSGSRHNPMMTYKKQILLKDGQILDVQVKHRLVESSIGSKSKVFAEFFKEAVENADVIIYGGHSGLGGNLDIPSLEAKAGTFKFKKNKKQIFFFESCSSYSYYLEHFRVEKTKSKIDILTNGLSSYFHTSNLVVSTFMDHLLTSENSDPAWQEILDSMESTLEGATYLLNVGGI